MNFNKLYRTGQIIWAIDAIMCSVAGLWIEPQHEVRWFAAAAFCLVVAWSGPTVLRAIDRFVMNRIERRHG